MECTSNGSESNLEGGLVRGGRSVSIAQFRDSGAHHLCACCERRDRKLHQGRAGICRQDVGLVLDFVGDKSANRSVGFETPMGAMVDLNAGAVAGLVKRKRDGVQLGGEFFIGKPCDEDPVVDKGQVGDSFQSDLPPRTSPPSKLDSEPFEVHSTG